MFIAGRHASQPKAPEGRHVKNCLNHGIRKGGKGLTTVCSSAIHCPSLHQLNHGLKTGKGEREKGADHRL